MEQTAKKTSYDVQQMRNSDEDKALLRALFKDRDDLLILVRNLFFGFDLTNDEKQTIRTLFQTNESRALMRKVFLPELGKDVPLGQTVDMWMTIKGEGSDVSIMVDARWRLTQYLETALALLENPDGKKVELVLTEKPTKKVEEILISRKEFIQHVELQLQVMKQLANSKMETEEERVVRQAKDSLK